MNKQASDITWLILLSLVVLFVAVFWAGFGLGRASGSELPAPQQVAHKAIDGRFGKLEKWQQRGYEKLLQVEPKKRLAWVTNYSYLDAGCDRTTASGMPVSMRVAAMLGVPFGTYVLVDLPKGYELRQVFDRGSRRNISRARSKGAVTWCDRYLPHRSNHSWVRNIYVF